MTSNQSEPTRVPIANLTAENEKSATHPKHQRAALSPGALAKRWGCCRQSIYNAINDGELHSFKFRNRRLIPLSEIERIERGGHASVELERHGTG